MTDTNSWPAQPPDLPRLAKGETVDLLVIGAHPDDVELTSVGLLLQAKQRGQRTAVIDCTRGEMASNGDVPTRDAELLAAAQLMQLDDRVNLNMPDGGVRNTEENRAAIARQIRRLRPRVVVTPPLEDDDHPDHFYVARTAFEAIHFASKPKYRPDLGQAHTVTQIMFAVYRQAVQPTFVIDITDVWDTALAVAKVFGSQLGTDGRASASTFIASDEFMTWWTGRRAFWGGLIKAAYGEGYTVRTPMRLEDPLAFFQSKTATR